MASWISTPSENLTAKAPVKVSPAPVVSTIDLPLKSVTAGTDTHTPPSLGIKVDPFSPCFSRMLKLGYFATNFLAFSTASIDGSNSEPSTLSSSVLFGEKMLTSFKSSSEIGVSIPPASRIIVAPQL